MIFTYSRVGLAHSLENTDVEGNDTGSSGLLVIVVEPQVVSSVGTQVKLLSVQVVVPHIYYKLIIYKSNYSSND